MSEWVVRVVKIGKIEKHSNADSLSITQIDDGYPCIFRTGDFKEGDLAVYIPIDSVVPCVPEFEFLGKHRRIDAKRLRGVFSMGLLISAKPGMQEGDVVDKILNITKYEPDVEAVGKGHGGSVLGGEMDKNPGFIPVYTDIDSYRKCNKRFNAIIGDRAVVVTEKLHGTLANYTYDPDRKKLWVGTHKTFRRSPFFADTFFKRIWRWIVGGIALMLFKLLCRRIPRFLHPVFAWAKENRARDIPTNTWVEAAAKYGLYEKLKKYPWITFFGEIYGWVQDLKYGAQPGEVFLRFFDAYDTKARKYLDWALVKNYVEDLGLDTVPVLYEGPWKEELTEMRNGMTVIQGANHLREGFVVHPYQEMWDERLQRVILKFVGEEYQLRNKKEKKNVA